MKINLITKCGIAASMAVMLAKPCSAQDLKLNDLEYFEKQGVNVLVYSNNFNGGFNDEKNSGIEIIHHGVRTVQGGAVRLNNTPEQWDLVPKTTSRKVNETLWKSRTSSVLQTSSLAATHTTTIRL